MTRKDYELIASVIARHVGAYKSSGDTKEAADKIRAVGLLAAEISKVFGETNPRFDSARFLRACDII